MLGRWSDWICDCRATSRDVQDAFRSTVHGDKGTPSKILLAHIAKRMPAPWCINVRNNISSNPYILLSLNNYTRLLHHGYSPRGGWTSSDFFPSQKVKSNSSSLSLIISWNGRGRAFNHHRCPTSSKVSWKNIICRHGLPHCLMTNNGRQFIDGGLREAPGTTWHWAQSDLGRAFTNKKPSRSRQQSYLKQTQEKTRPS